MALRIECCHITLTDYIDTHNSELLVDITKLGFKISSFDPLKVENEATSTDQLIKLCDLLELHEQPKENEDFVVIDPEGVEIDADTISTVSSESAVGQTHFLRKDKSDEGKQCDILSTAKGSPKENLSTEESDQCTSKSALDQAQCLRKITSHEGKHDELMQREGASFNSNDPQCFSGANCLIGNLPTALEDLSVSTVPDVKTGPTIDKEYHGSNLSSNLSQDNKKCLNTSEIDIGKYTKETIDGSNEVNKSQEDGHGETIEDSNEDNHQIQDKSDDAELHVRSFEHDKHFQRSLILLQEPDRLAERITGRHQGQINQNQILENEFGDEQKVDMLPMQENMMLQRSAKNQHDPSHKKQDTPVMEGQTPSKYCAMNTDPIHSVQDRQMNEYSRVEPQMQNKMLKDESLTLGGLNEKCSNGSYKSSREKSCEGELAITQAMNYTTGEDNEGRKYKDVLTKPNSEGNKSGQNINFQNVQQRENDQERKKPYETQNSLSSYSQLKKEKDTTFYESGLEQNDRESRYQAENESRCVDKVHTLSSIGSNYEATEIDNIEQKREKANEKYYHIHADVRNNPDISCSKSLTSDLDKQNEMTVRVRGGYSPLRVVKENNSDHVMQTENEKRKQLLQNQQYNTPNIEQTMKGNEQLQMDSPKSQQMSQSMSDESGEEEDIVTGRWQEEITRHNIDIPTHQNIGTNRQTGRFSQNSENESDESDSDELEMPVHFLKFKFACNVSKFHSILKAGEYQTAPSNKIKIVQLKKNSAVHKELKLFFKNLKVEKINCTFKGLNKIMMKIELDNNVLIQTVPETNELEICGERKDIQSAKMQIIYSAGNQDDLTVFNADNLQWTKCLDGDKNRSTTTTHLERKTSSSVLKGPGCHDSTVSRESTSMKIYTTKDARPKESFSSSVDSHVFFSIDRKVRIEVSEADITKLIVECIVNAANAHLNHSGGVSKAIAVAAGSSLDKDCSDFTNAKNTVGVTDIFVSNGGHLPAKYVFHAVGPRWHSYGDKANCLADLRRTILRCLLEGARRGLTSIALPSISAAVFKVPQHLCAENYMKATKHFCYMVSVMFPKVCEYSIQFVDVDNKMTDIIVRCFIDKWDEEPQISELKHDKEFAINYLNERRLHEAKDRHDVKKVPATDMVPQQARRADHGPGEIQRSDRKNQLLYNPQKAGVTVLKINRGEQPVGYMYCTIPALDLSGYEGAGCIMITYDFPGGYQGSGHPNPGKLYDGRIQMAFLPNTEVGIFALQLLRLAFIRMLTFRIERSNRGAADVIVWNGIEHKINGRFGYPDPTYPSRLKRQLDLIGVCLDSMTEEEQNDNRQFLLYCHSTRYD